MLLDWMREQDFTSTVSVMASRIRRHTFRLLLQCIKPNQFDAMHACCGSTRILWRDLGPRFNIPAFNILSLFYLTPFVVSFSATMLPMHALSLGLIWFGVLGPCPSTFSAACPLSAPVANTRPKFPTQARNLMLIGMIVLLVVGILMLLGGVGLIVAWKKKK